MFSIIGAPDAFAAMARPTLITVQQTDIHFLTYITYIGTLLTNKRYLFY